MKILYYDCFAGISGDMNMGALVDLGVDADYLRAQLDLLNLSHAFTLQVERKQKNGITGTKVDVILKNQLNSLNDTVQKKSLKLNKGRSRVSVSIKQEDHHHRNLRDIQDIIHKSTLSEEIKNLSLRIFRRVAVAEAKVHGKSIEEVHFHEVGAIDSIVDIVGAAICIDALGVDQILASPIQLGGGFVKCAHGLIPVPAPATIEILKGIPVRTGLVMKEMTTPTGAAILAEVVESYTEHLDFEIDRVGYGLGTRDLEIPNVVRVYLGHRTNALKSTKQVLLETNIDDMNPELFTFIEEKLFAEGALDVYKTPIIMKKGRSATMLSVLCTEETEAQIIRTLFTETSTLGLRKTVVDKLMLDRELIQVMTPYGEVTVKKAYFEGKCIKYKAEYDDCAALAKKNHIPLETLYKVFAQIMEANNEC